MYFTYCSHWNLKFILINTNFIVVVYSARWRFSVKMKDLLFFCGIVYRHAEISLSYVDGKELLYSNV